MKYFFALIFGIVSLCSPITLVIAEESTHTTTREDNTFYEVIVAPALQTIKQAMPPAPDGWVVESESRIEQTLPEKAFIEPGGLHYNYTIRYKRLSGVNEELKRLTTAYSEIQDKINVAFLKQTDALMKNWKSTEQELKKATKLNDTSEGKRLRQKLNGIDKKIEAAAREHDQKISQDMGPYLVKDKEVEICVTLNESETEFPKAKGFTRPKTAFALRTEGEQNGPMSWKEGRTLILYGDWQEIRQNSFRANMEKKPFWPKPQTITLSMVGDSARIDQMLKKTNMKAIVSLMK